MAPVIPLCPQCGAPPPSLEAVRTGYRCGYCDRVVEPESQPTPAAAPEGAPIAAPFPARNEAPSAQAKLPIGCGLSMVTVAVFVLFALSSPKSCATIVLSEETESALAAVRRCPRAMQLVGDDPAPSWVGCVNGESKSGSDSGSGSWSIPISGARASATLEIDASKHKKTGWRADSVTLEVGDTRVDVVSCKDLPRGPDD